MDRVSTPQHAPFSPLRPPFFPVDKQNKTRFCLPSHSVGTIGGWIGVTTRARPGDEQLVIVGARAANEMPTSKRVFQNTTRFLSQKITFSKHFKTFEDKVGLNGFHKVILIWNLSSRRDPHFEAGL